MLDHVTPPDLGRCPDYGGEALMTTPSGGASRRLRTRYRTAVLTTATIGTATRAPMMPARTTPAAIATMTASGWIATALPMISAMRAWRGPRVTSATSTATEPEIVDPTIGTNAPRKTSAASGNASGTSS